MTSEDQGLRERLVQQALDLLERTGEVPSLRAVARAAGVSAMTPYGYFADKAALMGAVADRGFAAMAARLEEADRRGDQVEALIAQGVAYVDFASDNPALFRLIYSHECGHARTAAVRRTHDILRRRIASLLPSRTEAATLGFRSLLQGVAATVLDDGVPETGSAGVEEAIRLMVEGLAAVRRPS